MLVVVIASTVVPPQGVQAILMKKLQEPFAGFFAGVVANRFILGAGSLSSILKIY
jgi:hypothetical protein